MLDVKMIGLSNLQKTLKAANKEERKALNTAIKVQGFQTRKELQAQIRKGAQFEPLTHIAKYAGKRKSRPLKSLAKALRYEIPQKDPIEMHVGWVGSKTSKSWKRIAEKQQKGFKVRITDEMRAFFRSRLRKESTVPKRAQQYFKVRKSTEYLETPARPIIDPFWEKNKERIFRNVAKNWARKIRGERIG